MEHVDATSSLGAVAMAAMVAAGAGVMHAQRPPQPPEQHGPFGALQWRNIGPLRGGRSQAVAGSAARPLEYYFGATGGGLWKTTDGGTTWQPVTDGQIRSSSITARIVPTARPSPSASAGKVSTSRSR